MTQLNGNIVLPLLESLVSAWSSGKGCTVATASDNGAIDGLSAEGPGFLYRWNDKPSPVEVTFLPGGRHQIEEEEENHVLFIRTNTDSLSIQLPNHPVDVVKANERQRQQIEEIVDEAGNNNRGPDHYRILTTINAAQRLIVLGHEAYSGTKRTSRSPKIPAKHRLITELHDWFGVELENSVKLGDAAKRFKKSPRQLIRVLKETTGSGFSEHLSMHRLVLARMLLMRTDVSIMEVAKKSGFNSREQFIRSFSKAFGWTPLQFRKAWNKASLSNSDLARLCQIAEREPVAWQTLDRSPVIPAAGSEPAPHTLVIANALHQIVELFLIESTGKTTRIDVLDRGSMIFVNRDTEGSRWLVQTPGSDFERVFVTPDKHSVAVISSELVDMK